MQVITKNISQCYLELFRMLKSKVPGILESHPRGKTTYEFLDPVMIIYRNPRERFLYIPGRKLNLAFSLAEVIWILSGNGNVDWISFYNGNMRTFSDEGKDFFNAAYGKRIRDWGYAEPIAAIAKDNISLRNPKDGEIKKDFNDKQEIFLNYMKGNNPIDQLVCIFNKLKEDPDTRQACITLWDPRKDTMLVGCHDYPCNSFLQFILRDGKLNLSIYRRSNDIIWGLPYNVIQFSYLLEMMAGWLNVEVGNVREFINCLHVYFGNDPKQDETTLLVENSGVVDLYTDSNDGKTKGIIPLDARMSKENFDKFFKEFYVIESKLRNDFQNTKDEFRKFIEDSEYLTEHWKQVLKVILLHHAYKCKDDNIVFELYETLCPEFKILVKDFYKRLNS